jgi:predicted TIM-barrel fold metal-dependent hydrolase
MLAIHFLHLLFLFFSAIAIGLPTRQNGPSVPYYTLEEHWLSPSLAPFFLANPLSALLVRPSVVSLLRDIGPERLASMDANNIRVQVISHIPIPDALGAPNLSATANDNLADAIAASRTPSRFRGFCMLPMELPAVAAKELHRCIKKHRFVGALVDVHLKNGSFYDGREYDSLWAAFVQLGVPVYLHPNYPLASDVFDIGKGVYAPTDEGEYEPRLAAALGTVAWGWHERTSLAFLRLYVAGVFDRFPALQIILGHMGEIVPYMLARSGSVLNGNRTHRIEDVYARNIYITTSGMFSLDPMATVLRNTKRSRIMYSVDWPLSSNENGTAFMNALWGSGMVTEEEFEDVSYRNAGRLLKV